MQLVPAADWLHVFFLIKWKNQSLFHGQKSVNCSPLHLRALQSRSSCCSSGNTFHKIYESICGNLCPFWPKQNLWGTDFGQERLQAVRPPPPNFPLAQFESLQRVMQHMMDEVDWSAGFPDQIYSPAQLQPGANPVCLKPARIKTLTETHLKLLPVLVISI